MAQRHAGHVGRAEGSGGQTQTNTGTGRGTRRGHVCACVCVWERMLRSAGLVWALLCSVWISWERVLMRPTFGRMIQLALPPRAHYHTARAQQSACVRVCVCVCVCVCVYTVGCAGQLLSSLM